jgi:hypothetical protein
MGVKVYRPRHQGLPFAPSAQIAGLNGAGLDLAASHFVGIISLSGVSRALTGSFLLDKTIVNNAKNASKPRKHWSVPIAQMDRATVS